MRAMRPLIDGRRYWYRPHFALLRSCSTCAGTVPYGMIGGGIEPGERIPCTCPRGQRAWRFTCPWPCNLYVELGA